MHPFPEGQTFAADVAKAVTESLDLPNLRRIVSAHVAQAVADPRVSGAQRIVLTGSGDSLFAALCLAPVFRRWTGLPTEGRTAMEQARYHSPLLTPEDLVVSISNSGSSSRAREVVLLAKERGAMTVGVTGSMTGELARNAIHVIHRPIREDIGLPEYYGRCLCNFAEYLAVLYALYCLGLALGVKRGHISVAFEREQLARIEAAIEAQGAIAARIEPAMMRLCSELGDIDTLWTIGSGPSQGTARYCAAKYHEQMPINGVSCDLEEWAHLEYFLTLSWGARSVVTVIAPAGNSLDRAREMVQGIGSAGGRAIVVHSGASGPFPHAYLTVDLGHEIDEWLSPLTFHLPTQLLVLHMAVRAGIPHIPLRRVDGTWLICKGIVRQSSGGLA
ncbi:MAG TPA: SIS domain-containing protein [Steroidobacteraceae bacterium]|nr:SIS domain-containing protein [Steroidobacteraceae bacterium]